MIHCLLVPFDPSTQATSDALYLKLVNIKLINGKRELAIDSERRLDKWAQKQFSMYRC